MAIKKVSDIGEHKIIDIIRTIFGVPQKYVNKILKTSCELNDDAAILELTEGMCIVLCIDMINEGIDFHKNTDPFCIGFTAVSVVVSDIIAMGAKPVAVGMAWGVPNDTSTSKIKKIARGIENSLANYQIPFIAGDFNSCSELTLSSMGVGVVKKNNLIRRKGAKVGDPVAVTGQLGGYTAGYYLEKFPHEKWKNLTQNEVTQLRRRFHKPRAKVNESQEMVNVGGVTSMIDLSDGLLRALNWISSLNDVGIMVEEYNIPYVPAAVKFARELKRDTTEFLLSGEGGSYELMITCDPNSFMKLKQAVESVGNTLTRIGTVTKKKGVRFSKRIGEKAILIRDSGFEQFAKKTKKFQKSK